MSQHHEPSSGLTVYDLQRSSVRPATQADMDRLEIVERAYRRLRLVIAETEAELRRLESPLWSCGHRHETRGEAMDCRRAEEQRERADAKADG